MTSKRRRAARAWMGAERKRSEERIQREVLLAARNVDLDWKRRLTRILPADPHQDTFYPQGRLDRPFIRVALHLSAREFTPPLDYYTPLPREEVILEAKLFALVLPNGVKVMWWGWEMR